MLSKFGKQLNGLLARPALGLASITRTTTIVLNAKQHRELVIKPTLLEIELWSPAAEELVFGTAIVESRLSFIRQLGGGPALGLWQIEPDNHREGYENFLEYREGLYDQVLSLSAPGQTFEENLTSNMQYGAAICRLCYYRAPEALPDEGNLKGHARYWKRYYNTPLGAGTEGKYIAEVEEKLRASDA